MYCYYFFRLPLVPPPKFEVPHPETDPEWYGEIWIRYPGSAVATPLLYGHAFRETVRLRLIQADIATASFQQPIEKRGLEYEMASNFKARLNEWFDALPPPFSSNKLVFPNHISLQ